MSVSSLPATGEIIAGKLRIVREIGVGGMGVVFEVEHTLTKHRRAVKLLHGEYARSQGVVARFLREASAAGRIGNAHVVETFDAGTLDSGEPYIVMELLEGWTLGDEIERRGALSVAETCDILLQACEGIRAAHAAGIVHRDLKPENLFLLRGSSRFVKILDFGISKFDPQLTGTLGMTQEGMALGTPFYMPPEQVRGQTDIGVQADIYALGVMLYECLTGDKPYQADTLPHLAVLIYEGRYTPPTERNPSLPAQCDAVVAAAMAADCSQRYASVEELATALKALREMVVAGEIDGGGYNASSLPPAPGDESLLPAPRTEDGSASAQTSAAFGQTRPGEQPNSTRRLGWWLVALLVVGALAVGVGWTFRADSRAEAEPVPVSDTVLEGRPKAVAAEPSTVVPAVDPDVSSAEPAAPPAESIAPVNAKAPSTTTLRPKTPAPQASSRARELGLSEENPF